MRRIALAIYYTCSCIYYINPTMPAPKDFKPTRLELELLNALWGLGAGSIREIQESLPAD